MSEHRACDRPAKRAELRFASEVTSAFRFLESEYGMTLMTAEPTLVRYEGPAAFVNVFHGRGSYELDRMDRRPARRSCPGRV